MYNPSKEVAEVNRIRQLRLENNMKQADLAKMLKCAPTAISKYELEQLDISSALINQLCDIFGCSSDYLLCRTDLSSDLLSKEEEDLLIAWRGADDHARRMVDLALEPFKKEDAGQKAI